MDTRETRERTLLNQWNASRALRGEPKLEYKDVPRHGGVMNYWQTREADLIPILTKIQRWGELKGGEKNEQQEIVDMMFESCCKHGKQGNSSGFCRHILRHHEEPQIVSGEGAFGWHKDELVCELAVKEPRCCWTKLPCFHERQVMEVYNSPDHPLNQPRVSVSFPEIGETTTTERIRTVNDGDRLAALAKLKITDEEKAEKLEILTTGLVCSAGAETASMVAMYSQSFEKVTEHYEQITAGWRCILSVGNNCRREPVVSCDGIGQGKTAAKYLAGLRLMNRMNNDHPDYLEAYDYRSLVNSMCSSRGWDSDFHTYKTGSGWAAVCEVYGRDGKGITVGESKGTSKAQALRGASRSAMARLYVQGEISLFVGLSPQMQGGESIEEKPELGWWQRFKNWVREKIVGILEFLAGEKSTTVLSTFDKFVATFGDFCNNFKEITDSVAGAIKKILTMVVLYLVGFVAARALCAALKFFFEARGVAVPDSVVWWRATRIGLNVRCVDPCLEQLRVLLKFYKECDQDEVAQMRSQMAIVLGRAVSNEEAWVVARTLLVRTAKIKPAVAHSLAVVLDDFRQATHDEYKTMETETELKQIYEKWRNDQLKPEAEDEPGPDVELQSASAVLSFLAAAIGCAFTGGWPRSVADAVKYARDVSTLAAFGSVGGSLVDTIVQYCPSIVRFYYCRVFNPAELAKDEGKRLHKLIENALSYKDSFEVSESETYYNDIVSLQDQAIDLMARYPKAYNLGPLLGKLSAVISRLVASRGKPVNRMAPYVIWLYGESGVGKTVLAQTLAEKVLDRPLDSSEIAQANGTQEFYESLTTKTKVVVMDEALLGAATDPNGVAVQQWLHMCGNSTWMPPKALAEAKSSWCAPELVIATSNVSHPDTKLADPTAVARRRNKLYQVQISDLGKQFYSGGVLDTKKMPFEIKRNYRHLRMREMHPVYKPYSLELNRLVKPTKIKANVSIPVGTAIKELRKEVLDWRENQRLLVRKSETAMTTYKIKRDVIAGNFQGKKKSSKAGSDSGDSGAMDLAPQGNVDFLEVKADVEGETPQQIVERWKTSKEVAKAESDIERWKAIGKKFDADRAKAAAKDAKKEDAIVPDPAPDSDGSGEFEDTVDSGEEEADEDVFKEEEFREPEEDPGFFRRKEDMWDFDALWKGLAAVVAGMAGIWLARKLLGKYTDRDKLTEEDLDKIINPEKPEEIEAEHQSPTGHGERRRQGRLKRTPLVKGHMQAAKRRPTGLLFCLAGEAPFPIRPIRGRLFYTNAHLLCSNTTKGWSPRTGTAIFQSSAGFVEGELRANMVMVRDDDFAVLDLSTWTKIPQFSDQRNNHVRDSQIAPVSSLEIYVNGLGTKPASATMQAVKCTGKSEQDGVATYINNAFRYGTATFELGDCGREVIVVTALPALAGKILGIHSMGTGGIGICQVVSKEDLDQAIAKTEEEPVFVHQGAPRAELVTVQMTEHKPWPAPTVWEVEERAHVTRSSGIEPAEWDLGIVPTKSPAALRKGYYATSLTDSTPVMKDPLAVAINDLTVIGDQQVDMVVLNDCVQEMKASWEPRLRWQAPIRVLTEEEAVVGIPGFLPGAPDRTSAGYPLSTCAATTDKKQHYRILWNDDNEARWEPKASLVSELRKWYRWLEGMITDQELDCRYKVSLKDELIKTKKAEAGFTRLVFAAPFCHWILQRRYFGSFIAAVHHSWHTTTCGIGLNPTSFDLDRRIENMADEIGATAGDKCFFAGDGAQYDRRLLLEFMQGAEQVILHQCEVAFLAKGEHFPTSMAKKLLDITHKAPIFYENKCQTFKHGHRSGNPMTGILNSLTHELMFRYAAKKIAPEMPFDTNVAMMVVGDDNLVGVRDKWQKTFNALTYSEEIGKLDQIYTSEDKETPLTEDFRKVTECTFLGCDIKERGGFLYGALEKNRIFNMMCYRKRTESTTQDNVLLGLKYMAGHGEEEFKNWQYHMGIQARQARRMDTSSRIFAMDWFTELENLTMAIAYKQYWGVSALEQMAAWDDQWAAVEQLQAGFNGPAQLEEITGRHQGPGRSGGAEGGLTTPADYSHKSAAAHMQRGGHRKIGLTTYSDIESSDVVRHVIPRKSREVTFIPETTMDFMTGAESAVLRTAVNINRDEPSQWKYRVTAPYALSREGVSDVTGSGTPLMRVPFESTLYLATGVEFEFKVVAPATAAGSAVAMWVPLASGVNETEITPSFHTYYEHVRMDLSKKKNYRMKVDFLHRRDKLNNFAGTEQAGGAELDEEMGVLLLGIFMPMIGADSVTISVWSSFVGMDTQIPKPIFDSTALKKKQRKERAFVAVRTAKAHTMDTPLRLARRVIPNTAGKPLKTVKGQHQGNSSSTTNETNYIVHQTGENTVGELSNDPNLTSEARQSIKADADVDTAVTGMDVRERRGGAVPVYKNNPGLSKSTGHRVNNSLQLGQKSTRAIDIKNWGSVIDETNLAYLGRLAHFAQLTWDTSMPEGTLLAGGPLSATSNDGLNLWTQCSKVVNLGLFHRYKAMVFRLLCVTNPFINGQLRFTVAYGSPDIPEYVNSNTAYSKMLIIGDEQNDFEVEIPFVSQQPMFVKTPEDGVPIDDRIQNTMAGYWGLYVVQPLTMSDSLEANAVTVSIQKFLKGLQVAVPDPLGTDPVDILLAENPTTTSLPEFYGQHQGPARENPEADCQDGTVEPEATVMMIEEKEPAKPSFQVAGRYQDPMDVFPKLVDSLIDLGKRQTVVAPDADTAVFAVDVGSTPLVGNRIQWYAVTMPRRFLNYRMFKGGFNFAVQWNSELAQRTGKVFYLPTPTECVVRNALGDLTRVPAIRLNAETMANGITLSNAWNLVPRNFTTLRDQVKVYTRENGVLTAYTLARRANAAGNEEEAYYPGAMEAAYGPVSHYNVPFQAQYQTQLTRLYNSTGANTVVIGMFGVSFGTTSVSGDDPIFEPTVYRSFSDDFEAGVYAPLEWPETGPPRTELGIVDVPITLPYPTITVPGPVTP